MRKIVVMNRLSLDGFFAGVNGEIDWFVRDNDLDKFVHTLMKPDTLLMGRLTYQMFEASWPPILKNPDAPKEARVIATELNDMTKFVFSHTLDEATWVNTQLVAENIVQVVKDLKSGEGMDMTIFGSGTIVQQLAKHHLIDEYIIIVTPAILGSGKSLFENFEPTNFELVDLKRFESGNVVLHYK